MLLAAGLGVLIGLCLGALGGGGGVLMVPALVYALGQSAQQATTSSIIIVGLTAVTGTLARLRGGQVDWRTGLVFGVFGLPAAYLGTLANHRVSQHVLLLAFAALTVLAAAAMLINGRRSGTPHTDGPTRRGAAALVGQAIGCGLVIGFLTGFLGVGGGFLVVPALVIGLRMPMSRAVGTSLLIIAANSVSALAARIGVAEFEWRVILPFTLAAVAGALAGKRISGALSGDTLTRAFAVLLAVVGAAVAVQSLGQF